MIMMNKMIKGFVDFIYMTGRVRKNFERDNPNEKILAADASKGIITEKNQGIKMGSDWVVSQRAVILLTDKRIICGKWTILLDTITTAQLLVIGSGQVLKIQTEDGKNYQFGMQFNSEWTTQQTLLLAVEKGQVKYSFFSIIVRLMLVGYLICWVYGRFIVS